VGVEGARGRTSEYSSVRQIRNCSVGFAASMVDAAARLPKAGQHWTENRACRTDIASAMGSNPRRRTARLVG